MADISNEVVQGIMGRQLARIVQKYNLENVRLATDQYLVFEIDEKELSDVDREGEPIREYTDLVVNLNDGSAEFKTWDSGM